MRADRLLSMLMLLQSRGRMTALDLAAELGISERTVYRDMEALSIAGIPVYAERGPGGGIALVEEYRTNLTGMTSDEARALFLLNIPLPLQQLGVGGELNAALTKLAAALPESSRKEQLAARQRIHLDALWWGQRARPGPHLSVVEQAVFQERRLAIRIRTIFEADIDLEVSPLGLVAKASEWYMVALRKDAPQVYRVRWLLRADLLPDRFNRPQDFDLERFWRVYCEETEADRHIYWATVRVSPHMAKRLRWYVGEAADEALEKAGPPDEKGWRVVELPFENVEEARARLLPCGRDVYVIEPLPLRLGLVDFATQITRLYAEEQERTQG